MNIQQLFIVMFLKSIEVVSVDLRLLSISWWGCAAVVAVAVQQRLQ